MVESILKTALNDDDFEFKVKAKPFPITKNLKDKGSFITFDDMTKTRKLLTMSDVNGFYSKVTWEVVGAICAAWYMLNTYILIQLIRERTSERKLFLEAHGQSKCSYWMARYVQDCVFYLPISVVATFLIRRYETNMEAAPVSIFVQPFAMLPFIYLVSFCFRNEMKALLTLLTYSILF